MGGEQAAMQTRAHKRFKPNGVLTTMDWSLKPITDANSHKVSTLVDRLSSLPDELLIQILSLLPTKDAAATCVLGRRLMHVFPLITSLDFSASPISLCLKHPYAVERYPTFVRFVDNVLQAYQSKYLTRFRLEYIGCDYYGCKKDCLPDLKFNVWISFSLTLCGLRELDLCIMVKEPGDAQLPPAIFTCGTLEVLKLQVSLGLDQVFAMPSYRLPNLKLLMLSESFISDDDFLPRLVSSCPLLEDLTFKPFTNHVHHTTVVSTSLRRLCLIMNKVDDDYPDNTDLVLIDTPNLEYFHYSDNLAFRYSIPIMHRLAEANLSIEEIFNWEPTEISFQQLLSFIRLFSHVPHLSLLGNVTREFDCNDEKVLKDQLPVFSNLKHLELSCAMENYYWNKLMLPLLNCSPVLETLVFREGLSEYYCADYCYYDREPLELEREFFKADHAIPSCCRYHLKRIVIDRYYGLEREVGMIQFLLRHALVLEELIVYRCQIIQYPIPDRISVENTLKNLPKASVTCSIQVL